MVPLGNGLLARLWIGDKPRAMSQDNNAALDIVSLLWGVESSFGDSEYYDANRIRNRTIDLLDELYPGWRGWDVTEAESKAVNHV
jgi:hypothetical protein